MTATTITRPAPAVGLIAAGLDPRPCATKPAQWWDLGDKGNPRAIRYCRNVCPLRKECAADITDEVKPKGQIRAGRPFNEYGKQLTICGDCDTPRTRIGKVGAPVCGCTPEGVRSALTAAADAGQPRPRIKYSTRDVMVTRWLPLHQQGMTVRQAAEQLGLPYNVLKSVLHRARCAGDKRVPLLRPTRTTRSVTA